MHRCGLQVNEGLAAHMDLNVVLTFLDDDWILLHNK